MFLNPISIVFGGEAYSIIMVYINSIVGASLIAQLVKNPSAMQETPVRFLGQEDLLEKGRDRLPTPVFLDFHCDSAGKESAHNAGDLGSIHGLGRSQPNSKIPLKKGKATHSSILAWRTQWPV